MTILIEIMALHDHIIAALSQDLTHKGKFWFVKIYTCITMKPIFKMLKLCISILFVFLTELQPFILVQLHSTI